MIRKYWVDITNIDDLMDQLINLFLGTNNWHLDVDFLTVYWILLNNTHAQQGI